MEQIAKLHSYRNSLKYVDVLIDLLSCSLEKLVLNLFPGEYHCDNQDSLLEERQEHIHNYNRGCIILAYTKSG
jgi:hypothetical protein